MNKSQLIILTLGAMVGIATAIKPESINGGVGSGLDFEYASVRHEGSAIANKSSFCCEECNKNYPGTQLYTYMGDMEFCMCENPKNGNDLKTHSVPGAFTGVCECIKDEDCNGGKCDGNNVCRDCLTDDDCTDGTCTAHHRCRPIPSATDDSKPQALPLTIRKGCNGDGHGIKCCPAYSSGDSKSEREVFVEEASYQGSCQDTCESLYRDATGATEHVSQTYGNGQSKCWCEFGQSQLEAIDNYRTCVFIY